MEPVIEDTDTAIELKPSPPDGDDTTVEPSTIPHYGAIDDGQSMNSSTSLTIKGSPSVGSSNLLLRKESGPHDTHAEMEESHETVYFSDGVRRIDYIFAYVDHDDDEKKKKQRYSFEANLRETFHLELEKVDKKMSLDGRTNFVKVNVPFDVACLYAEKLQIKVELHEVPCEEKPQSNFMKQFIRLGMGSAQESSEPHNLSVPFRNDLREAFVLDNPNTFLSGAMRSRIVAHILSRCEYLDGENKRRFGIDYLVNNGTYTAAFTMHDSKYWQESADSPEDSARARLYQQWGRPFACQILQPHSLIRSYYGDKVAMYFAWLGFYTRMLFLAAVVGTICFLYGVAYAKDTTWSKELCDENIGGKMVMCPQCDQQCTYWRLNSTCTATQQSYLFDNQATMFFSVFMGIWATIFLEMWKRYQVSLAPHKGLSLAEQAGERPRPEYEALCTKHRRNPITQEDDAYMPWYSATWRVCTSAVTVLFWISLVLVCIMAVIVYRLSVFFIMASNFPKQLGENEIVRDLITPAMVTSLTASCINFVVIMILNQLYVRVAIYITNLEVPKTQTAYENSLTMKMFLFQFVNYYSSIFYIAFFKGKFVGFPREYVYLFGRWRNEECDTSGCLMELTTQLTIIMVGKQIWGNVQEVVLPWAKNKLRLRGSKSAVENPNLLHKSRWESDYCLQDLGRLGLFYEYLEMVVQFGFTTLFVVSFPLAPLLALLNNLIEMRLDAWKFVTQYRRPTASRAQTIGVWQQILYGLAMLSVVTNAFIVAFTSDTIPRSVYYFSNHDTANDTFITHTMVGYINSSLSVFRIEDFQPWSIPNTEPYWFNNATDLNCRYRDYRYPPGEANRYELTTTFWHVLAARLAYIIVVEHLVFAATFCVAYMIPDIPQKVLDRLKRERHAMARIVREWEVQNLRHTLTINAEDMLADGDVGTL
uniref:anoctamin-5-like isoform X2 n=1 Tax=Myxine glutinosa TaxID=7769 RepID=UPI0035900035